MNAKKMIRLCNAALGKLDDLEGYLAYISPDKEANQFVYESMLAVRELKHIARWETYHNVTTQQASHIQQILSKTDYFLNLVPASARKETEGGQD
jgi:hypothetical protein